MRKLKETVADVPYLMKEWDTETNIAYGIFPEKLGSQSNTYAYWKCHLGHQWRAKISNRYHGRGCPECRKSLKTSFPEQAVYFYIKQRFPDAINGYTKLFENGMELDVYIPSIQTGIEYDGVAWHQNASLDRERKKYEICKQNGIELIRLKENKEHFQYELGIADRLIFVLRPFTGKPSDYHYLDRAIRELLFALFDYDPADSPYLRTAAESYRAALYGPKVRTDVNTRRDKTLILENYLVTREKGSFGTLYPEYAKLWHESRNGELTPFMFSPHSNKRVWWRGECGHEWENPITVVTRGQGCPYCSGQRVLKGFNDLETVHPELALQWHPTENGKNKPDMFTAGSGHRAYWLCPSCKQTWIAAINNRTKNNRGCPFCSHQRAIKGVNDLATIRPDLIAEWDYEKNIGLDPTDLLPNSNKKAWWKCSKCGFEYKAMITNRNKGTGCRQCAGQVLLPGINDLQTLFPDIASEWDVEANQGFLPCNVFPGTNKKYHWKCKYGHTWYVSPNARVGGRGCPVCSGNRVEPGFNDLATTHPEIAALWHPTMNGALTPTQVSKGHVKKVWFLCPNCHQAYDSYIGNVIKGYGKCPYCSKRKTRARVVYQVETGKYYNTLKEAARAVGKEDISQIQMCCKGRCQTAAGYHWEYREKP